MFLTAFIVLKKMTLGLLTLILHYQLNSIPWPYAEPWKNTGKAMQELTPVRGFYLFWIILALLALQMMCCTGAAAQRPQKVGGKCEYKRYMGTAEIVSVTLIGSGKERLQDEYEVKWLFHPREKIEESFVRATDKELRLYVDNDANPRRLFIEQHDIRVGKQIECALEVITRGTCTPVIFKFPWTGSGGD